MSKPKADNGARETVLLRQAMPKYNFNGRKLPKDFSKTSGAKSTQQVANSKLQSSSTVQGTDKKKTSFVDNARTSGTVQQLSASSSQTPPTTTFTQRGDVSKSRPVAVVGASLQSGSLPPGDDGKNDKSLMQNVPLLNVSSSGSMSQSQQFPGVAAMPVLSPIFGTDMKSTQSNLDQNAAATRISESSPSGALNTSQGQSNLGGISNSQSNGANYLPSNTFQTQYPSASQTVALFSPPTQDMLQLNTIDANARLDDDHVKTLESENDRLKKDLDVQLQVNAELKRLLVASVGEDLSQRVERLCRDRAQLSLDLGGYSKKMSEEYENLDKVSIQADMWRSKYLASRVMIEELGNARAYYSLQCHDSQDALQQMLNERHELRTNLLETHKVLQQVKGAFDPLNSHRSSMLRSTNVLDLSRSCQQLSEAMRFRLLPAHVAVNIEVEDNIPWADSVTRAEQFAHEVLSRPTEPAGSLQSGSSRLLPITSSQDLQINRFHPHTRHENLTYNCCHKCKGEINVI